MDIAKGFGRVLIFFVLLFVLTQSFDFEKDQFYESRSEYVFSKGNAPDSVRTDVISQLRSLQVGYAARDTSTIDQFMGLLFSKDNITVLGTMPKEIYVGVDETSELIVDDWQSWGDVRFVVDEASVSASGNVAWISTVGYVEFDLSRFLVVPLRLSGVLVEEGDDWKFQYLQFQFDLDFAYVFLAIILLLVGLVVSLVMFLHTIAQKARKAQRKVT